MSGHVLITRPIEDATELADDIHALGYETTIQPFLIIEPVDVTLPDMTAYDALIFTSANGIKAFCAVDTHRDTPIYVVGQNTQKTAEKYGFSTIINADGSLKELESLLNNQEKHQKLLYLRARDIAHPLQTHHKMEEVIIYQSIRNHDIPSDLVTSIQNADFSHILFFSRRTAQHFVTFIHHTPSLETGLKRTKALCLGDSMLEFLEELPWHSIHIADMPNRQGMVDLLK